MSKVWRVVAVAFGLTTILLARRISPLVRSAHEVACHWNGRPSALFAPVLIDEAIWCGLLTLVLLSARRPGRWRVAVWAGTLVFLPWLVGQDVIALWPKTASSGFHFPSILFGIAVWVLVVLLWRPAFLKQTEAVIGFLSTVLAFVAISGALFTIQLGWSWWGARAMNDPPQLRQEPSAAIAAGNHNPRVIWIVLDELSYQQVYEHRYPGLQLPAFDALAADSAVFTHAVPAGRFTEKVLPALMTGVPVDDVSASASGQLSIHNSASGKWQRFDQHDTVFQDAVNDGDGAGVAGWYIPYCRILPAVLDHCFWTYDTVTNDGAGPYGSFAENAIASFSSTIGHGVAHRILWKVLRIPEATISNKQLHIDDYQRLVTHGDALLRDRSEGLVLLHIPVPHPPPIFDRATDRLTAGTSSYVNNLALADEYLAQARAILEQSGQWDSSVVIVMGDHSWRPYLWKPYPGWTAEDERASGGGKFDPRPFYVVKLAGEHTGARIDAPFRALKTRGLIESLLAGKIRTADDLRAWVETTEQVKGGKNGETTAK